MLNESWIWFALHDLITLNDILHRPKFKMEKINDSSIEQVKLRLSIFNSISENE